MNTLRKLSLRFPLISFFALAFTWTWCIWTPLTLSVLGKPLESLNVPLTLALVFLGATGPTVAAFALSALHEGRTGVKALLRRYAQWRVAWPWYVALLATPPLIWLGAAGVFTLVTGNMPQLSATLLLYPLFLLLMIFTGPLAEEGGWRGYALPRLQQRLDPLVASVFLGVIWAVWHLPMFWMPGIALPLSETGSPEAMLRYLLKVVPVTILMTWVYNKSQGSILFAMLFHAGLNASGNFLLPLFWPQIAPAMVSQLSWIYVGVAWLAAGVVAWRWRGTAVGSHRTTEGTEQRATAYMSATNV